MKSEDDKKRDIAFNCISEIFRSLKMDDNSIVSVLSYHLVDALKIISSSRLNTPTQNEDAKEFAFKVLVFCTIKYCNEKGIKYEEFVNYYLNNAESLENKIHFIGISDN